MQSDLATADQRTLTSVTHEITLFDRIWPAAVIAVGLALNVIWIGVLGYGLVSLITLLFER